MRADRTLLYLAGQGFVAEAEISSPSRSPPDVPDWSSQRRRGLDVRVVQAAQSLAQRWGVARALGSGTGEEMPFELPL